MPGMLERLHLNVGVETSGVLREAGERMVGSQVPLDPEVQLIDVVCPILSAILNTDNIERFSITPLKVGCLPRKLLAVNRHRLFEPLATIRGVLLKGSTDLHPRKLVGLRVATHLPHDVVHIDVGF